MKILIAVLPFLAIACAFSPAYLPYRYSLHSSSLISPNQQQYHTQDDLGQYSYGYSEPLSAKQEMRSLDGVTRGSYSYRDAEGKLQTVDYTADADGFHVAATNLPKVLPFRGAAAPNPVADTAAVAAARAAHAANYQEVKLRLAKAQSIDQQSNTVSTGNSAVELSNTLEDTVDITNPELNNLHQKRVEQRISAAAIPVAAYQPTFVPSVYRYTYQPFNSRFLGLYYY